MRGWLFKDLGPGAYSGNSTYEKVGDIQIEGNFEYRFPIYSFLKEHYLLILVIFGHTKKQMIFQVASFIMTNSFHNLR